MLLDPGQILWAPCLMVLTAAVSKKVREPKRQPWLGLVQARRRWWVAQAVLAPHQKLPTLLAPAVRQAKEVSKITAEIVEAKPNVSFHPDQSRTSTSANRKACVPSQVRWHWGGIKHKAAKLNTTIPGFEPEYTVITKCQENLDQIPSKHKISCSEAASQKSFLQNSGWNAGCAAWRLFGEHKVLRNL